MADLRYKHSGFTLLEALISGVILFMVISAAVQIFSSSLLGKAKSVQHIQTSAYLPMLVEHIKFEVNEGNTKGTGHWLGIDYSWVARQQSSSPVKRYVSFGEGAASTTGSDGTAILWSVLLTVDKQQFSLNVTTSRSF